MFWCIYHKRLKCIKPWCKIPTMKLCQMVYLRCHPRWLSFGRQHLKCISNNKNAFSWNFCWSLWLEFNSQEFIINSGNALALNRWQIITWNNNDQDQWLLMASYTTMCQLKVFFFIRYYMYVLVNQYIIAKQAGSSMIKLHRIIPDLMTNAIFMNIMYMYIYRYIYIYIR